MFKTKQLLEDFETKLPEKFSLFKKMSPKRSKRKQNLSFSCHLVHHKPQSERERQESETEKEKGSESKRQGRVRELEMGSEDESERVCAKERREREGVCE